MPKNLYIGDLHFGHEQILWLDNRPFGTVEEMDDALIRNWQQAVSPDDTVYVLGDMFWRTVPGLRRAEIIRSLPGRKILVRGNHDTDDADAGFDAAYDALTVKDGSDDVYLCHYPCIGHPGFYKGAVHLYAHVHNSFEEGLAGRVRAMTEALYEKPCRMYNTGAMMPWMGYAPRTLKDIEAGSRKCALNAAYGYHPEASRMLTLSTAHISGDTAGKLEREPELNAMGISVYTKSAGEGEGYGWFVYLPSDVTDKRIPPDLKRCLARARALGCSVLCLDCDGPEDPGLEKFDW